eukprot:CAMPEP_0194498356 /NCGR_PEP_ID=MMETSP0253-20130528/15013_1 /TAXON_ID=2966 /ORGANISM="Noctiluca scintillans" /LENGTH=203 /DNA_ID=CAMNT_0039339989 /DNA_START=727 /DNA_END=1339 /DNA_ORIENTATION=-
MTSTVTSAVRQASVMGAKTTATQATSTGALFDFLLDFIITTLVSSTYVSQYGALHKAAVRNWVTSILSEFSGITIVAGTRGVKPSVQRPLIQEVQVHPTGLVKTDGPDVKNQKFGAAEALYEGSGLVWDALGNCFAMELGRRDYVTGERWKNKPPFRLALHKAASDDIAVHCRHYTERGVMKFYESEAALTQVWGVPSRKMEE